MKVTGNKIFVSEVEYKSAAGIIAPKNLAKQGYKVFEVMAVGPGERNPFNMELIPVSVKPGDRIIADIATAPVVTIIKNGNSTKYNVISEKDIQVILEDGEEAN